jgi:hypothetical protein
MGVSIGLESAASRMACLSDNSSSSTISVEVTPKFAHESRSIMRTHYAAEQQIPMKSTTRYRIKMLNSNSVCVCVRERERERDTEYDHQYLGLLHFQNSQRQYYHQSCPVLVAHPKTV